VAGKRAGARLARAADRGARAGLAMLAARAVYRRLKGGREPSHDELEPIPRAIDDEGLERLKGELSAELDRRVERER
jgi:hypothetical protein